MSILSILPIKVTSPPDGKGTVTGGRSPFLSKDNSNDVGSNFPLLICSHIAQMDFETRLFSLFFKASILFVLYIFFINIVLNISSMIAFVMSCCFS